MKPKGTGMTLSEEKSFLRGLNWRKGHTNKLVLKRRLSKTTGRDWLWNPPGKGTKTGARKKSKSSLNEGIFSNWIQQRNNKSSG